MICLSDTYTDDLHEVFYPKHSYLLCISKGFTMYPHGYHHNGFMATPEHGTQDVCLSYVYINRTIV